jgi:YesN/AraC family two-component response regulator
MYSIIIADDEREIRNGLSAYIDWGNLGYTLAGTVENGEQAIDLIQRGHVDVALCDIRMPVKTGLDVARYVYENHIPTTVVLFSAYRDFEYARTAMQYGVKHYIVKSTKYADLLASFVAIKDELDRLAPAIPSASSDDTWLAEAKSYIQAHLDTASLEDVATHLNRSASHVSRRFKEDAGEGFFEHLLRARMEYAARLLSDARIHTYEVAARVGYSNPKNFARAFRQHYQMSPREYRDHHPEAVKGDA